MKKYRPTQMFLILLIVSLFVSLFTACQNIRQVEKNQVEKMVVWTHNTEEYELNGNDSSAFIQLYNASKYEGKGTGEGGTPAFGITVYFCDGTYLRVNDFYGKLEVWLYDVNGNAKKWYYVSNQELYTFMSELAMKIDEINN